LLFNGRSGLFRETGQQSRDSVRQRFASGLFLH